MDNRGMLVVLGGTVLVPCGVMQMQKRGEQKCQHKG